MTSLSPHVMAVSTQHHAGRHWNDQDQVKQAVLCHSNRQAYETGEGCKHEGMG